MRPLTSGNSKSGNWLPTRRSSRIGRRISVSRSVVMGNAPLRWPALCPSLPNRKTTIPCAAPGFESVYWLGEICGKAGHQGGRHEPAEQYHRRVHRDGREEGVRRGGGLAGLEPERERRGVSAAGARRLRPALRADHETGRAGLLAARRGGGVQGC